MKKVHLYLAVLFVILLSCGPEKPVLKIGLVADPQYADQPSSGTRIYRESLRKLNEAVDTFNYYDVDFVQNLGDIIDNKRSSFDSILPIYKNLDPDTEVYHLLGNHEFSIDSPYQHELLDLLSMPGYYYSYVEDGWRFIVLDATDYSYFSSSLHHRDTSKLNAYFESIQEQPNAQKWNGGIGIEQKSWLIQKLDSAELMNQKVILFSHLPIAPEGEAHNLWNDSEIVDILENYPNAIAFINGHNHAGNHVVQNGIHYITMIGMVENNVGSYGILEIYQDSLILKGFGDQETIHIEGK